VTQICQLKEIVLKEENDLEPGTVVITLDLKQWHDTGLVTSGEQEQR